MALSEPIATVICEVEPAFSQPTWSKVQVLIIGTLRARGRRTVTAALRQMGLHDASNFSLYHHVLNRARWSRSPLVAACCTGWCGPLSPWAATSPSSSMRRWSAAGAAAFQTRALP